MTAIKTELKRWTILDVITNKIYDGTDQEFYEGITNNIIKFRGKFVEVENKHTIWIDGIVKK